jgi:transcriptional regulator with XRE-family HTH domain
VPTDKSYSVISAQVIRLLQAERKRRGLSKYALSARCGLTQQTIGYVERGLRQPSFETVLRLADGIGIDLADILKQARTKSGRK